MATGSEQSTTFSVRLDDEVSAPAEKAAASVDELRAKILGGESAVKNMSGALRRLRGSTDDVKKAKEQLKARINAERDAISASQLALLKAKSSTGLLATAKKGLSTAVSALNERLSGLTSGTKVADAGLGALKYAAVGLAAALAAVAVATAGGLLALGKFIIAGANAARTMGLLREAAAGSAENGAALGSQVDALAAKVPTGKAAINELALALAKSNLRGETFVDTLNAVSQASAAMGDEAGGKIRALVDRGRTTGRLAIGADTFTEDLKGTGLQRDDVAKALAEQLHVGVDKARAALAEGRVKLADGAAALRAAVEKKFAGINLRQMLDLNVIAEKLRERFDALTKGVNLEPLLKGFSELAGLFDESTVAGAGLKEIFTVFGSLVVGGFTKGLPLMKQFFKGLVIGALQATVMFLKLGLFIKKAFGDNETLKKLFSLQNALKAGTVIAGVFAVGIGLIALAAGATVTAFALLGDLVQSVLDTFYDFGETIRNIKWGEIGSDIVSGIIGGIKNAASLAVDAARSLAERIKSGFTGVMKIQSPSKVFAGYGKNTVEGYVQGVEDSTPEAARSLNDVGKRPPAMAGAGAAPSPLSVNLGVSLNVAGGGPSPDQMAKAIQDPSILAQLTKAIETVLLSNGIPVTAS